jgi:soluble lytic murein transglycosylase-like protein
MISKNLKYNGTDQDLYMSVFYPAYRRKPINMAFPSYVQSANPGIKTPGDYINKVNAQKYYPELTAPEWTALKDTASKLGIEWEPLYKMINFESGWNAKAKNNSSGARGLIQFIPSTAKGMGYKGSIGILTLLLLAGAGFFTAKKLKLL